jgi:hypothetical protein
MAKGVVKSALISLAVSVSSSMSSRLAIAPSGFYAYAPADGFGRSAHGRSAQRLGHGYGRSARR